MSSPSPGRPERRLYLDSVVDQLWSRPGQPPLRTSEFLMLPSPRVPTLVVPRRPRRATASLIRSYKSSAGPFMRGKLRGLALAARWGVTDLLPFTTPVATEWASPAGQVPSDSDLDIVAYLEGALGRALCVGLYTSPPRANRKPVLHLVSPQGESVGFVKIGTSPLTRDLVTHEAEALRRLQTTTMTRLMLPSLLLHAMWRDHVVLVQGALRPKGRRSPDRDLVIAAMRELSQVDGVQEESVSDGAYVSGLDEQMSLLPETAMARELREALTRLRVGSPDDIVRVGAWHGDWTPWNMAPTGDRVAVWDWERLGFGIPVGFDLLHHDVQTLIVRGGREPLAAARALVASAPDALREMGVHASEREAHLVAVLYLLEIGTRYLHDEQEQAGARLGDLRTWLLPTVREALDAMATSGGVQDVPG